MARKARATAEDLFRNQVDVVLAMGVQVQRGLDRLLLAAGPSPFDPRRYQPGKPGRVIRNSLCVHSDVGVFLSHAFEQADALRRPANPGCMKSFNCSKRDEARINERSLRTLGVDPMRFVQRYGA